MVQLGKKNNWLPWLYSYPMVAILATLTFFAALAVWERLLVEREMNERRMAAEVKQREALQRQAALETEVAYFEGERGVEAEIRQHFNVAQVGETVIILTGEVPPSAADTKRDPDTSDDTAWLPWKEWWQTFFSR